MDAMVLFLYLSAALYLITPLYNHRMAYPSKPAPRKDERWRTLSGPLDFQRITVGVARTEHSPRGEHARDQFHHHGLVGRHVDCPAGHHGYVSGAEDSETCWEISRGMNSGVFSMNHPR